MVRWQNINWVDNFYKWKLQTPPKLASSHHLNWCVFYPFALISNPNLNLWPHNQPLGRTPSLSLFAVASFPTNTPSKNFTKSELLDNDPSNYFWVMNKDKLWDQIIQWSSYILLTLERRKVEYLRGEKMNRDRSRRGWIRRAVKEPEPGEVFWPIFSHQTVWQLRKKM